MHGLSESQEKSCVPRPRMGSHAAAHGPRMRLACGLAQRVGAEEKTVGWS
jgi:hypothetical protein